MSQHTEMKLCVGASHSENVIRMCVGGEGGVRLLRIHSSDERTECFMVLLNTPSSPPFLLAGGLTRQRPSCGRTGAMGIHCGPRGREE